MNIRKLCINSNSTILYDFYRDCQLQWMKVKTKRLWMTWKRGGEDPNFHGPKVQGPQRPSHCYYCNWFGPQMNLLLWARPIEDSGGTEPGAEQLRTVRLPHTAESATETMSLPSANVWLIKRQLIKVVLIKLSISG